MYENNYSDNTYHYGEPVKKQEEPHNKKKGSGNGKKIALGICCGLLFGIFAGIGFEAVTTASSLAKNAVTKETTAQPEVQSTVPEAAGSDSTPDTADASASIAESQSLGTAAADGTVLTTTTDVTEVVKKVMPSVVSVNNKYIETTSFFGQQYNSEGEASGSGIIVGQNDSELLIATNNHVLESAEELTVQFTDGSQSQAQIKGTDADKDLAVIAVQLSDISSDTMSSISIATLGDSNALTVGESVIAIGNALGYGQSVTTGVVSALNRAIASDGSQQNIQTGTDTEVNTFIQTDAAINPGNSGGALLNSKGELIGINTVKYSSEDVEGMGYAIPINTAKPIINKLIKNEATSESEQAYLGVSGQTIDSSMASQFDMPSGVYVQQVIKSSPAQKAGISAGDVIVSFNGSNVSTMDGLKEKISNLKAGKKVKVVVKRQNQMGTYEKKTLTVTLGKKSDAPSTSSNSSNSNSNSNNSNSYNNNYNNESSNSQYYSFGQ